MTVYLSWASFNLHEKVLTILPSCSRTAPIAYVLLASGYKSNGRFGFGYSSSLRNYRVYLFERSLLFLPPGKFNVLASQSRDRFANLGTSRDVILNEINHSEESPNLLKILWWIDA